MHIFNGPRPAPIVRPAAVPLPAPVASLTFVPAALAGAVGDTLPVVVRAWDGPNGTGNLLAGRNVTLASSAPAVVSVTGSACTLLAAGTATLTATCEGKSATCDVTATAAAVATPPAPAPTGDTIPAAFARFDGGTGAITAAWGLPLPARLAGLSDAQLLTLRLYRTDTGAELATSAPTRLVAAKERAVLVGTTLADGVLPPVRYGFSATGLARLAPIAPDYVPRLACWPRDAADLCGANLMGMRLVPKASRGTLPAWATRLDDAYPGEWQRDTEYVEALPNINVPGSDALVGEGRTAAVYDRNSTALMYGARIGGAQGHAMLRSAVHAQDRWDNGFMMPSNGFVLEFHQRLAARPACYWLSGHSGWLDRIATATNGGLWVNRYTIWQNNGLPTNPPRTDTDGELRTAANSVLGLVTARRVGMTDITGYPGSYDQPNNGIPRFYGANGVYGPVTLDIVVAIYLGQQAASGSWGGMLHAGDVGSAAPGTPGFESFEVEYLASALAHAAESGYLSAANLAKIPDALGRTFDYLNATARQVRDGGLGVWYEYVWPCPTVYNKGSTDPNALHDNPGDPGYAALNAFGGRALAYLVTSTGLAKWRDLLAQHYYAADQERYGPASVGGPAYYQGVGGQPAKAFDQAHYQAGAVLAALASA